MLFCKDRVFPVFSVPSFLPVPVLTIGSAQSPITVVMIVIYTIPALEFLKKLCSGSLTFLIIT